MSKENNAIANLVSPEIASAKLMEEGVSADHIADMVVNEFRSCDDTVYSVRMRQCYYLAMMDNSVCACLKGVVGEDNKKGGRKASAETIGAKWAERELGLSRSQFFAGRAIGSFLKQDENGGIVIPKELDGFTVSSLEVIASKAKNNGGDIIKYIDDKGLTSDMSVRDIKQACKDSTKDSTKRKPYDMVTIPLNLRHGNTIIMTIYANVTDENLVYEAIAQFKQGLKKGYAIEIVTED